jgi:putative nucleotidyltransferase with HDIG domain
MNALDCKNLLSQWLSDETFPERLPEVAALRGVLQSDEYHGEGDAYVHTMLAVDALEDDADRRVFWAVLLHDIGKAVTTRFIDGRWRSRGHEEEGAKLVPGIMTRLGLPGISADVTWLVRHHDFLLSWNLDPGDRLTPRQRRFMKHPLFSLLLRVNAADASASWGRSRKGEIGRMLEKITVEYL